MLLTAMIIKDPDTYSIPLPPLEYENKLYVDAIDVKGNFISTDLTVFSNVN
jgi:hypothetical protein